MRIPIVMPVYILVDAPHSFPKDRSNRRAIAAVKTALAWIGVKHRGKARMLDYEYHRGYWRGLS